MGTIIQGYSSTNKVPGGYGEVIYGAGAIAAADIPLELLLVGLMTSGTATADTTIVDVGSVDDAVAAFGARSQLTRMCKIAALVPGVTVKAIALTSGGGVASAMTFTVAGTWTTTGTYTFRVAGETYQVTVLSTDAVLDVSTKIRDAINANVYGPTASTVALGVATVTVACAGPHGDQYQAFGDSTGLPSGCTVTLAGGAALTGGGVYFTGGTTAETVTAALTTLFPTFYDRIGIGQNLGTALSAWKTQINLQATPLEGRRQHVVAATNVAYATAASLANTTLNAARFQLMWQLNAETHPSEIAAVMAALRTSTEQGDPCAAYDDVVLPGVAPVQAKTYWPSNSTLVSALNNGLSPLLSSKSQSRVCRSIVTKCLNGTTPDYRCLDTSDAVVPDYVLKDLLLLWSTQFKIANPRVRDNPAPEEPNLADGIATPELWNRTVIARLRKFELGAPAGLPYPIIINVSANLPQSNYDAAGKRIMQACPVVPAPNQHAIGISVRQQAA